MSKTAMTYSNWRDYKKKNAANQIAQLSQQGTVNNGGTTANTTITYSDWRDYKKASQVDQNYIDSFFTDAKKFVYSSAEEYQGIRWKNASGIYKVKKTTADDLQSRSKNIRSYLELNKDKYTEDVYTKLSSYLDSYDKSVRSVIGDFKKAKDHYSQWETEAEYKEAVKISELYNMSSEEIKPYLSQNQDEIDQLKTEQSKLEKGIAAYNHNVPDPYGAVKTYDDVLVAEDKVAEIEAKVSELESSSKIAYTTSDGQNITWQSLYDDKKEEEEFNALYAKYSANDDWEKNSKYITTNKKGTARSNSITDSSVDWNYEDVNKSETWIDYGYASVTTPEEKAIFNYIYHTEGEEAAFKWHKSREAIYKERMEGEALERFAEFAEKYPFLASGVSTATNLLAPMEHSIDTAKYFFTGELDDNSLSRVSSTIRGTVTENRDWNVLGYDVHDFLYESGMSMLDSYVASQIPYVGAAVLGQSAAASATNDALDRGMSDSDAFWTGAAAGGFETLFESWSIGKFKAMQSGVSSGGKAALKNIVKSMAVNASEEFATEIANIAYDRIANGEFSQYETSIRAYMASGMTESEATGKVVANEISQVIEAAASGAVTGIGFGAIAEGGNAIGSTIKGKQIKNASKAGGLQIGDLVDIGKSLGEGTESYKLANKITDKSSAYAIGTLYGIEGIEISEANRADIIKSLERKGYDTATASSIADIMLDSKNDEFASVALQNPETFSDIILNPKSTVSQRTRAYDGVTQSVEAYQEAKKNGKKNAATEASIEKLAKEYEAKGLSPAEAKAMAETQLSQSGAVQSSPTAETAVESKYEVADDGKTTNIKTGKEVKVNKIESISSSGEANLTLDDGMIVNASDIAFSTPAEAMFIETIGAMKLGKNPISVESANALYQNAMTALKANPNMTASEAFSLIKGLEESYIFGAYNFSRSELSARNEDGSAKRYAGELSQSQRKSAYELGKKDSISKAKAEQKTIDEKVGKAKTPASKKTSGKIVYEGGINVDKKSLTKTQQAHLEGIKLLATVTNYEIHVFKSEKVGKTYKYTMPDGTVRSANGWYRVGTNEIWIDLNAGNLGEGIMLETAGHEIGHDIKRKSPKQWKAIADLVMKTFAENNVDTEAMLKRQVEKVKRKYEASNKDMPSEAQILEEAYEEMVCDALSGMLIDGSIVNFIAEVKAKDRNLAQRILDAIKNLLAKWGLIIDDYKGRKLSAPEAQALAQFEDAFKQVQALYRDALMDTDAVNAALEENTTDDGDVKFEIRYPQFDSSDFEKNILLLSKMQIVKKLSGNEFAKAEKPLSERVMDYFNSLNNNVYSDVFGDVALTNSSMRDDIYGHGRTTQKITAFAAIPEVIQQGVVIDSQKRGNGNYDRIIVAAPISIGADKYLMGVMLQRDHQSQRLYLHDVVAINEKETMVPPSTTPFTSEVESNNDSLYMTTILKKALNVKENSENLFPTRDTLGNALTEAQQSYFAESKVRDENGNLKVMYHGTPNATFTKFRSGTYFTEHKWYADRYQNQSASSLSYKKTADNPDTYAVYLDIKKPFDTRNPEEARIFNEEYFGHWGMGTPLMESGLPDWLDGGDLQEFLEEQGYDYDGLILDEGSVGGYGDEVISRGLSYVVFNPEQVKSVDNKNPTKDADYRFSIRDTDTFSRIQEMQTELNQINKTILEMQQSEEFKTVHDKLSEAITNGDVDEGIKVYQEWQDKSGYVELSKKRDALQEELKNLRKSFEEELVYKALSEEKEAIAKSGLSEADYFRKQAVKEFGYTPYFYDAGYIVPNGRMLNFSGEKGRHFGSRGEDHRGIGRIYATTQGTAALTRFMNDGNIRIMAESPGIDVFAQAEPTSEQYNTIRKFAAEYAKEGYFNVDISDESGKVIGSLEYENNINPTRIINDIKHYYATGEVRRQSDVAKFLYSDRDSNGRALSAGQIEYFKDSKIRDEKGRLLAVYHGTKSAGFTRFTKTDEIGYFFARSLKTAQTYSNNSKVVYTPDRYTDTAVPNEANYQVYLNIKKPYIIDGKGANWNGLESTGEKVHLSIKTSYWGDDGKGLGKIVFKYGGKTYSEIVHNVNEFDLFISKHTNPQLAFACAVEMNAIADKNGKGKFEVDLIWDFKKRGNADSKNTRDIVRRAYNSEWDYDGVIFKNVVDSGNGTKIKADDLYVAFNSNQIKSTANTEPTSDPDIRYSDRDVAPTFYSQMGKVVEGVKQDKLAANSVVNLLRGKGVKAEEIRWSGIVPFLEGKKSVTKQELLDFINSSMLQIGEQMSDAVDIEVISEDGDNYIVRNKETRETLDEWEWDDDVEDGLEGWVNQDGEIALTVDEIREKSFKEFSSTRWSEYKLNGGENYREIVFTMPNSSYSNQMMRVHWGDEAEGVLVHARIQDFDVNGKKMLFIEEIQSDWHNAGHKQGYESDITADEREEFTKLEETIDSLNEQIEALNKEKGTLDIDYFRGEKMSFDEYSDKSVALIKKLEKTTSKFNRAINRREELYSKIKNAAPDAPFKDNYHEYVLKRLLRMAAEQGYDSIGWTPADIQDKRWDDKQYHEEGKGKSGNLVGYTIEYDQDMPKFLRKYGKQWGAKVGTINLTNGTEVWSMDITDSMKSSVLYEGQALYQERDPESSTRYILANSLESAAQNDVERRKLAEYKEKIALIEAEEGKLAEIQKRLFTKGEVDPTERKALQFEAKQLSNRINTYDRQLLNLEATTALKNVLNREKALAAKRQKQKDNEALKKYKEKVAETQRELMNRYQDSRKRATESRHKTEMRHKIQKIVSELNQLLLKGSKERNVKLGLQDSVAKALEAINMDTVGADERVAKYNDLIAKAKDPDVIASLTETRDRIAAQGDRLSDKLEAMRKAYAEIRNNSKEYAPYYQQEAQLIETAIEKTIDKVGDTSIRNMTLEQLEAVYDMYKVVLQTIRYANELHNEGKVEELRDNASAMMTELEKIKTLKEERAAIGDLIREFTWNEMTPIYAIRRTGSKTLEKFYWEMIRGQNTYAQDLDEADEFKAAIREKYGHSKWNLNKVYSFELKDGRTFRLTLEYMMSIYAYSKRPQAIDHMSVGGFFFNDKATFRRKGGLLKMIKSNEAGYTVDVETLNTIKDEMEKVAKGSTKYVDEMQDYLTKMGNKGNEVSRVVWGIDIFKEKIYFPLKSVKDFIFQANQPSQETSLKHDGMTKETKPGASNPIVLESFDDVWAGHVERMSQYHGFVIPIDNMNKLLNYGSWAGTDSISVSTMLRARFGDAVNEYFNQFIKDMNGASSASGAKNPFFSMVGKFKKTAVAASMSVVAQQPTAILRAAAVLDSRYFIGLPEAHLLSTKWSELKRYAPIAIIKDIGGFDAGGGRQVAEWLNSDARRGADKVLGKIDDITMWGAAVGDQVGWCAIWEAVKRETKAKHKDLEVGSEAFLKIAGERFTEVIVLTQVYDSTLSRSGYMRSKHDSVKMLTAFMGEPTVSINMQFDALLQAKRGTITKRKAGRILGATYAATIAASIAASLIYALRDDDEDESYLEKFAEAFGEKLIGDINPLNQLPAVRDIISIFEGWDVERTDMAVFKDIKDAFDGLFSENKSTWRKVEDFAGAVASIFGVPLKNLLRTSREIYNGYNDIFDGIEPKDVDDAFVRGIKGEKKDKSKALYDAIISGDEARIEVYRSQYEDDKAYETALRKSLRENDPRIKEAAEARSKGNVDKYMRIVKDIKGERNFSQDTIVAAINAEINSMKPKNKSEIGSPAYITVDDYYNSIVNGDTSTARTIKDKLVAEKVEQGYLQSEAEDSIATSFTSQVKSEYMDGNIKRSKAVDLINEYGNSESGAETEIKKCDFELEYGFSWSERARAYRLGKISASELKYAVMDIEGEDWQGAEDYIKFLNLEMANPNLDITASDAKGYFEYAEPAGINIEVYLSYKEKTSGLQGDKDANGKTISGSKKNKVLAVINSLPITYAQKDALYYMNGWSAKTINEAPWH